MENISNRTSHELYHGHVNSILKMGPCAYGPIKAIDPLPKGLDVHTNGSNLDCVVATTSISLLFLHPRCDSPPLWCLSPKWKCHKLQRNFLFCQIQYLCMWITLICVIWLYHAILLGVALVTKFFDSKLVLDVKIWLHKAQICALISHLTIH